MNTAEFEEGHKDLKAVGLRHLAQTVPNLLPELTNQLTANFGSNELRHLRLKIFSAIEKLPSEAEDLIARNLVFLSDEIYLRPSPFPGHVDSYLRDRFYSTLVVDDPEVELHLLDTQLGKGYRYPQVPSRRLFGSDREFFFQDEQTMLSIIWRSKIARGEKLTESEKSKWQERLDYIRSKVEDGLYGTPAGTDVCWFDTFNFKRPDVYTYNQGLLAPTLIMAERLGLSIRSEEINQAIAGFQSLTINEGRLRFSKNLDYKDVSSLMGEFLANQFGFQLLHPETVRATVETFELGAGGYKVVTRSDGDYLSLHHFNQYFEPGEVHNGANWPMFSAVARKVGEDHGLKFDPTFWKQSLGNLRATNGAESQETFANPFELSHDPKKEYYAWNALAYCLALQALKISKASVI